jgi:hypothetical protein
MLLWLFSIESQFQSLLYMCFGFGAFMALFAFWLFFFENSKKCSGFLKFRLKLKSKIKMAVEWLVVTFLFFLFSAPPDFGMLGVFYARFPPREASLFSSSGL